MDTDNDNTDLKNKCMLLLELVKEKESEINDLRNRMTGADSVQIVIEKESVQFFDLFRQFVEESMSQKWCVERKYDTKLSQNYVDVDFKKYRQFVEGNLDKQNHNKFKSFLIDLRLIEPETFEKDKGLFAGSAKNRKRVLRIRAEVYKRLIAS